MFSVYELSGLSGSSRIDQIGSDCVKSVIVVFLVFSLSQLNHRQKLRGLVGGVQMLPKVSKLIILGRKVSKLAKFVTFGCLRVRCVSADCR